MRSKKKLFLGCFFIMLCAMLMGMPVSAASAKLNKTKATVPVGKTFKLKVKNTSKKVIWSSSKKSVATVNSKGLVKAKNAGTATIKAKVGSKTLKCKVTVKTNSFTCKKKAWSKVNYCNLSNSNKVRAQIDKIFYDSKGILHAYVIVKNCSSSHKYNLKNLSLTVMANSSDGKILGEGYFTGKETLEPKEIETYHFEFTNTTKNFVNLNKCKKISYSLYTN